MTSDYTQAMRIAEWKLGPDAPISHRIRARKSAWIDLYRKETSCRAKSPTLRNLRRPLPIEDHDQPTYDSHDRFDLEQLADTLPPRHKKALLMTADGYLRREVGEQLGVSPMRISKIITDSINRLKQLNDIAA